MNSSIFDPVIVNSLYSSLLFGSSLDDFRFDERRCQGCYAVGLEKN